MYIRADLWFLQESYLMQWWIVFFQRLAAQLKFDYITSKYLFHFSWNWSGCNTQLRVMFLFCFCFLYFIEKTEIYYCLQKQTLHILHEDSWDLLEKTQKKIFTLKKKIKIRLYKRMLCFVLFFGGFFFERTQVQYATCNVGFLLYFMLQNQLKSAPNYCFNHVLMIFNKNKHTCQLSTNSDW